MKEVVIAGLGQTAVGEHWDTSLRELAFYAMEAARNDAGGLQPQALYVGNMLAPALSKQSHLATLLADFSGLTGIEAVSIEGAGASGGLALRQGYLAVSSGALDSVLVLGVEKMTDQTASNVQTAIATGTDADYEAEQGLTLTAQAALLTQRYMYEFDVPEKALGGFPITAHANAVNNPNAMFRRAIKSETYEKAGIVSEPLNMFDIAPNADGAAALLLTRPELIPADFPHGLVRISGSGAATDTLALHDRPDPLVFSAARLSTEKACKAAGIEPDNVNMFELYDAFSIYAPISLEAAGFAERGEGWKWAQNGDISLDGKLPILTQGGLKARGNPGGATGIYQAVEAALQLRQEVNQDEGIDARKAMVQTFGGPASTVVTHILEV